MKDKIYKSQRGNYPFKTHSYLRLPRNGNSRIWITPHNVHMYVYSMYILFYIKWYVCMNVCM